MYKSKSILGMVLVFSSVIGMLRHVLLCGHMLS